MSAGERRSLIAQPFDFSFINHGSVTVLVPHSAAAGDWIAEHIPSDALSWCGGVVIEPRFADPILSHIEDDGLTISAMGGGL